MIRGREEFKLLLEIIDLNMDSLGKIKIEMNDSKFENGNVDITACLLNKKKKVIEYVDIFHDISLADANEKADIIHGLLAEDEEFSHYYTNVIEKNYGV